MNKRILLLMALLCSAGLFVSCSSKKMTSDAARKVIAAELKLPEEKVEVKQVSEIGGTVTADATLNVTFVLQKDQTGQYKILKSRYGDQWSSPEQLQQQLRYEAPQSSLGRSLHQAFISQLNSH